MKKLSDHIQMIKEGGASVEGASPIRGDLAKPVADKIISLLKKEFKTKYAALGSVGKKGADQFSGDIDIAIEMDWERKDEVIAYCKKVFPNAKMGNVVNSLKVFNIGYEYEEGKIVQVDFMFVNDVDFADFAYHSPDFINNESKYKGMYASTLFMSVVACTPTNKPEVKDENGDILDYYRYTFNQSTGLMLLHKSYAGKKGRLKNAKTIDREFITKDVNKIIQLCLGNKARREDCYSFENLLDFIVSKEYAYHSKEQLEKIKEHFMSNSEMKSKTSQELLDEFENLFDERIK